MFSIHSKKFFGPAMDGKPKNHSILTFNRQTKKQKASNLLPLSHK